MNLKTGTIVTWHCMNGQLIGTIKSINLSPSAAGKITPWVILHRICNLDTNERQLNEVMLCGTPDALAMMKVEAAPC